MIIEYHRPKTVGEALNLLARRDPPTMPLGGGTVLNQPTLERYAVVDTQSLGLSRVSKAGNHIQIGASCRLGELAETGGSSVVQLPGALRKAISLEGSYNTRQVATVAGALVAADGRSPFAVAMLALDCEITLMPGEETVRYGDLLPVRESKLEGRLITQVAIPVNVRLSYQYVARSPADLPLVCVAVCAWRGGRTRVAVGGFGAQPRLALDGREPSGVDIAAGNAASEAGDQWASAKYRSEVARVLAQRATAEIGATG